MQDEIEIELRFFAAAAEKTGCKKSSLKVCVGTTLGQCVARVLEQFPDLRSIASSSRWAIETEFVDSFEREIDAPVVIAMIPPVSGG